MQPMAQWIIDVRTEYPGFNIVGECWYGDVPGTAYWQEGNSLNANNTMLPTVMDFPTMLIANSTFHGNTLEYGKGLNEIYNRLSLDYLYKDSQSVLTFLDNHDTDRFLLEMPKNLDSWKQGIAFLLTTRGIPQIYYGTELLMNGTKKISDGNIRLDVPGGFPGDEHNEFTAAGRSDLQNEALNKLYSVAERVRLCTDNSLKRDWEILQASDNFRYMSHSDAWGTNYESAYEAFMNYMNVLADFLQRVEEQYPTTIENEELNALLKTINNQEKEIEKLEKELKAAHSRKSAAK